MASPWVYKHAMHWLNAKRTELLNVTYWDTKIFLLLTVKQLKIIDSWGRTQGFPGGLDSKESTTVQETRVWALGWEDHLEEPGQLTPVFLPGESHGWRSLAGYSP